MPPEAGDEPAAACARLLGELGAATAVPTLEHATQDPRPKVREAAHAALTTIEAGRRRRK
jgi:HEAT repeat protein